MQVFLLVWLLVNLMTHLFAFVCFCSFFFRGKKCDRLNIALLTDLNTEASSEHLDVIIENLKQAGITLQFL